MPTKSIVIYVHTEIRYGRTDKQTKIVAYITISVKSDNYIIWYSTRWQHCCIYFSCDVRTALIHLQQNGGFSFDSTAYTHCCLTRRHGNSDAFVLFVFDLLAASKRCYKIWMYRTTRCCCSHSYMAVLCLYLYTVQIRRYG